MKNEIKDKELYRLAKKLENSVYHDKADHWYFISDVSYCTHDVCSQTYHYYPHVHVSLISDFKLFEVIWDESCINLVKLEIENAKK